MSKGMSEFLNPDMKNIFYDSFTDDCHLQMSSAADNWTSSSWSLVFTIIGSKAAYVIEWREGVWNCMR